MLPFAAAAVSGGNPIKTSFQAFLYSMRTMILPFLFIYDNRLLLIGIDSFIGAVGIFIKSTLAILVFTAASQGYFIVKSKLRESLLLLIISFSIFIPKFWLNKIVSPYQHYQPSEIYQILPNVAAEESVKLKLKGIDFFGEEKIYMLVWHLVIMIQLKRN